MERAVKLSKEKYCSATLMLAKTAEITFEVAIDAASADKERGGEGVDWGGDRWWGVRYGDGRERGLGGGGEGGGGGGRQRKSRMRLDVSHRPPPSDCTRE